MTTFDPNIHYIKDQIQKLRTGQYDSDDCLYRIATAADLLCPGDAINDSNRTQIEQWIAQFESGSQTGNSTEKYLSEYL